MKGSFLQNDDGGIPRVPLFGRNDKLARKVLDILFTRFAAQPFSLEQLEGQATAYYPAAELVYGLHLLRQAGLVNTVSRGWGEPLYALPLSVYFEIQHKSFLLLEADWSRNEKLQGCVKLVREAKRGLAHDLLRALSAIAQGDLPLTAKGRVQQRAIARFTGLFSLQEEDLAGLQLHYPEQEHYPPVAAVLLDMALALGLARRTEQAWAVKEHELSRWLRHPEPVMEGLLMAELLKRYVPARPFLQHAACALLHPAFSPGKWGSVEGILRQLRAKGILRVSPSADPEQAEGAEEEADTTGFWLLSWLKALCGFGWLELGYADEPGKGIPQPLTVWPATEEPLVDQLTNPAGLMIRWLRKPDLEAIGIGVGGFHETWIQPGIEDKPDRREGNPQVTDGTDHRKPLMSASEGAFFVQPDYEILVPPNTSYTIRWELELCCELISADIMTTYRLTRESVEKAMNGGRKLDEILTFLERHALSGVPAAVSLAVREWGAGAGRTSLLPATLLHCPDEQTADRIAAEPAVEGALERVGSRHFIVEDTHLKPVYQMLERLGLVPPDQLGETAARKAGYPRISLVEQAVEGRPQETCVPEAWIYAGKPFRLYPSDARIPNLEELFPGLRHVPASWTSELRAYHASTVKLLLQQALAWKAGVELRLDNGICTALPKWIKGSGEWRAGADLALDPSDEKACRAGIYRELTAADIKGIRIVLPTEN
ncbi:hypothetical protein AWM70_10690 [Paenibacillus yonginensis]|uniref:Helicase XPB/Ssl2 N-terminal domain-containing protein n=1 Tax=Paenibacillus yonginensis TaxID=1462996 RepID=A0A1B1N0S2_9BACL|nr:helicase-associated domain-containing protein [Paenibacillus yonginensis]ANS75011.1 hypothetical protein AWM70_10690 [Paenibacillus yonginensis]